MNLRKCLCGYDRDKCHNAPVCATVLRCCGVVLHGFPRPRDYTSCNYLKVTTQHVMSMRKDVAAVAMNTGALLHLFSVITPSLHSRLGGPHIRPPSAEPSMKTGYCLAAKPSALAGYLGLQPLTSSTSDTTINN